MKMAIDNWSSTMVLYCEDAESVSRAAPNGQPFSFGDAMALYHEQEGRFYRPDGSEIPFKRCKPGEQSPDLRFRVDGRIQFAFDQLRTDDECGLLNDGRSRVPIVHPDYFSHLPSEPNADGSWVIACPRSE
jgi:hypothetical protein